MGNNICNSVIVSSADSRTQKITLSNRASFLILFSNNTNGEGIIIGTIHANAGTSAKLLLMRGGGTPELYYDNNSTIALKMYENWSGFTLISNIKEMQKTATVDTDLTGFTQVTISQ